MTFHGRTDPTEGMGVDDLFGTREVSAAPDGPLWLEFTEDGIRYGTLIKEGYPVAGYERLPGQRNIIMAHLIGLRPSGYATITENVYALSVVGSTGREHPFQTVDLAKTALEHICQVEKRRD